MNQYGNSVNNMNTFMNPVTGMPYEMTTAMTFPNYFYPQNIFQYANPSFQGVQQQNTQLNQVNFSQNTNTNQIDIDEVDYNILMQLSSEKGNSLQYTSNRIFFDCCFLF